MPILYQIIISIIISVFWSHQAIGKNNISIETIAAVSDFGKIETQYQVFYIIMNTEMLQSEKKCQSDLWIRERACKWGT